jgi:glycerol kinase
VIAGLTAYATRGHIARAALEATAYQVYDLCEAMAADLGTALPGELRVDGGMIANELLMQFQAAVLDRAVVAPPIAETTALGAAYAAGLAVGFWSGLAELRAMDRADRRWEPSMDPVTRAAGIARWRKGVERSLGWVESGA